MAGILQTQTWQRAVPTGVVVCVLGSACFYVPQINPVPQTPDAPPALIGTDREETVDLSVPGDERFEVDVILDVNDPETIRYAFLAEIPGFGELSVLSGELAVRETQSFEGVTEYDSPVWEHPRCQSPLDGLRDPVTITLVLTDEVPAEQQRDGFSEWTVENTWEISFIGQCPEGS